MKKIVSILMVLVLMAAFATSAMAAFDTSLAEQYDALFDVDKETEKDGYIFIDTSPFFKAADLHYEFNGESDEYWSYIRSDLIVIDYGTADAYPVWRTWIYRYTKEEDNIDSVTFTFNGKNYTFTGILDPENIQVLDNGDHKQTMMIKHDLNNNDFMVDMWSYYNEMSEGEEDIFDAVMGKASVQLTFHGKQDITVELPAAFVVDFDMNRTIFMNGAPEDTVEYFSKVTNGTKLTVH